MCLTYNASKWVRPYVTRKKSESTTCAQKFFADLNAMGRPRCFRTDEGGEFTGHSFVEFCDFAGIRRGYKSPGKPQLNAVVKSATCGVMKGGHAVRREISRVCFKAATSPATPTSVRTATICGWKLWCQLSTVSMARRPWPTPGAGHRTRCSSRDYGTSRPYRVSRKAWCGWITALNPTSNRYRVIFPITTATTPRGL